MKDPEGRELAMATHRLAFESEIYRSALEAVPTGQLEAARTLGLSERQVLTLIRGPQAFRLALAPMTNDFVALLKDSSLVSVLTLLEPFVAVILAAAVLGEQLGAVPVFGGALILAGAVVVVTGARRDGIDSPS